MIKSEVFDLYVEKKGVEIDLQEAFKMATVLSNAKLLIDDNGHCHRFPEFSRSSSCSKIEFITVQVTGSMVGWETVYHFKTWLERVGD